MGSKVVIKEVSVNSNEIDIFDVSSFRATPAFFVVVPTHYNCEIVFSPQVLQQMLQWLIKEKYVIFEGTLTIPVRNIKKVYNG